MWGLGQAVGLMGPGTKPLFAFFPDACIFDMGGVDVVFTNGQQISQSLFCAVDSLHVVTLQL